MACGVLVPQLGNKPESTALEGDFQWTSRGVLRTVCCVLVAQLCPSLCDPVD